jgi:low temperature requirement protein LtrA
VALFGLEWPLPRRDPDEKSDPVELLVDITYVVALSQAASFMRLEPGLTGVLHALTALAVIVLMWQGTVIAVTFVSATSGPLKLLQVAQAGCFLAVAVCLPEAFSVKAGGPNGPVLFAAAMTGVNACQAVLWLCVGTGVPAIWRNAATIATADIVLTVGFVWASVPANGGAKTALVFCGYVGVLVVALPTILPTRWFGIGVHPAWGVSGTRALAERFEASYVVACCLTLELLEQAGQAAKISPAMLVMVFATVGTAYLLYHLYEPLVEPARLAQDPRNTTVSQNRKLALLEAGYAVGHDLMCGGLVVGAGASLTILASLSAHGGAGGGLGPPVATAALVEMYAGIAACLLGQGLFSYVTILRPDWLRLGAPVVLLGAIRVLAGRPGLVPVVTLLVFCAGMYALDQRRRNAVARGSATPPPLTPPSGPAGLALGTDA